MPISKVLRVAPWTPQTVITQEACVVMPRRPVGPYAVQARCQPTCRTLRMHARPNRHGCAANTMHVRWSTQHITTYNHTHISTPCTPCTLSHVRTAPHKSCTLAPTGSFSLFLSYTHTHAHTRARAHAHMHTTTYSHSHILTHTHTISLTHTHAHTHTLILILTYPFT